MSQVRTLALELSVGSPRRSDRRLQPKAPGRDHALLGRRGMEADCKGDDVAAVRRVAIRWTEAVKAADLGELGELMSDDIVVVHGDGRMLSGRSTVLADFATSFRTLRLEQQVTPEETVVDNTWAFERAEVCTSIVDPTCGKTRQAHSRTLTILRKEPSGIWRVARAIGVVCQWQSSGGAG